VHVCGRGCSNVPHRGTCGGRPNEASIFVLRAADAAARWLVHERRKGAAQELSAINGSWRSTTFRLNFFGSLVESTAYGGVWLVHLAVFGLGAYWVFDGQLTA
jgi:hypothetical protein